MHLTLQKIHKAVCYAGDKRDRQTADKTHLIDLAQDPVIYEGTKSGIHTSSARSMQPQA
jgi:hypothetical protein